MPCSIRDACYAQATALDLLQRFFGGFYVWLDAKWRRVI
ncbi:MAG: hypothetical protein RL240_3766 [Planctomycetota bacterium]|jgi:hypothetical protein